MTQSNPRFALIIASGEFRPPFPPLDAPTQDAAALARVLQDPAIGAFDNVRTLINPPSHEARREIEAFFAERKRDDLLLLYFSGHGVKDSDGLLYLATPDTERGLLRSTSIPAAFVNETMAAARSRRQVLILDCCYSGAFARGMVAKGGESVDVGERFQGHGRVVLTASTATQYAFQGEEVIGRGVRSRFTHYLVEGLESGAADTDGDGWVALDELYDYVHERLLDESPEQTPARWEFDVQGKFLIARNPHGKVGEKPPPPVTPPSTPPPPEEEYLTQLRAILDARFNKEELRTLCFDLGVDYDDLPGEGKSVKAAELIAYLERRGRLSELIAVGRRQRPDILWPDTESRL